MSSSPEAPSGRGAGRQRRRAATQVLSLALAALALLLVVGALVELGLSAYARRSPPGMLVDVGGRNIHVLCIGTGSPTVVFVPSGFGGATSFPDVHRSLSAVTRVCSFDRMGTGWSDAGPSRVSVGRLTDDLRAALDNAAIAGPMVLVASSIGGLEAEFFARRYPDRVAGLVMLDAANTWVLTGVSASIPPLLDTKITRACRALDLAAPTGLVRLLAAPPNRLQTMCALYRGLPSTYAESSALPAFRGDLPLAILTADTSAGLVPSIPFATARLERIAAGIRPYAVLAQQLLARQSTRGTWQTVEGSGHLIAADRPLVVIETVETMVEGLRRR